MAKENCVPMNSEKAWRVFLGTILLLVVSYIIYFVRHPMWQFFSTLEPIFAIMLLSYFIIFLVALLLLRKDSKKNLPNVFENSSNMMILSGLLFGLFYLGLYYLISFVFGSSFELGSFPNLRGFEEYSYYSVGSVSVLYLLFSVFGGFAEEVAYRGYVQTRVSERYGVLFGIMASTVFFSLEHIHVFQADWILQFVQVQLLHVVLFGVFVGYLFYRSGGNVWSVVSFHVLLNAFAVSIPIIVSDAYPFTFYVAEIASFTVMILTLKYLPLKNK
jgi:membrane protease YdiL (CAAX protease family)